MITADQFCSFIAWSLFIISFLYKSKNEEKEYLVKILLRSIVIGIFFANIVHAFLI
jgi:hypothetical protein